MINQIVYQVVQYGLSKNLLTLDDQAYAMSRLLALFKADNIDFKDRVKQPFRKNIDFLVKYAVMKNIIKEDSFLERIKFEAKIMDCLMPRPSELNKMFRSKYKSSPQQATKFFHDFYLNTHYIKTKPIEDNLNYIKSSKYGDLEIIINTNKPDLLHVKQVMSNHNFSHREASISVNNETNAWTMQYLPYPIVEEHMLVSRKNHEKPYNNDRTFEELIDFINKFPQYYIASDISIALSDDALLPYHYFQGGKHVFSIESADVINRYKNNRVRVEVLDWPVSAIRLIGNNENKLLDVMHDLHQAWFQYTNEGLMIQAKTNEEIHNLIDVMVKLDGAKFNVYMIFKNNKQTNNYPQGVFQPNQEILKFRFGILEDLGLISLSKRDYENLDLVKKIILEEEEISNHKEVKYLENWLQELNVKDLPIDIDEFLISQVGHVFEKCLEETNVFKFGKKADFISFIEKTV